jgi:hypothetical protein
VLYLTSEQTDLGKNEAARTQKALDLFRDGAKQNNAFCMFLYARCFEAGTGGRSQSHRGKRLVSARSGGRQSAGPGLVPSAQG